FSLPCISSLLLSSRFFLSIVPSPPPFYPLSLHDALPICLPDCRAAARGPRLAFDLPCRLRGRAASGPDRAADKEDRTPAAGLERSEEHTSELQSPYDIVCRLLLEKKKSKRVDQQTSLR